MGNLKKGEVNFERRVVPTPLETMKGCFLVYSVFKMIFFGIIKIFQKTFPELTSYQQRMPSKSRKSLEGANNLIQWCLKSGAEDVNH